MRAAIKYFTRSARISQKLDSYKVKLKNQTTHMDYEVQAAVSALGYLDGEEYRKEADCYGKKRYFFLGLIFSRLLHFSDL